MGALADLPGILRDAGYERDFLAKVGPLTPKGCLPDRALLEELTAVETPAHVLARVFYLAGSVSRGALESVLGVPMCELLLAEGILRPCDGSAVRADCAIVPAYGYFSLHDFNTWATGRPLADDYVLGVGTASGLLCDLTVRRRGERVLDIGTGQGFQAGMAAAHAAGVVGTDINPRALRLAGLAMRINNISGVEFRLGSFFEPVEQEKGSFDLLVSNPPFVIAPPHHFSALGGSWSGDSFVEGLIKGAPEYLRDEGWATILCNWHHDPDDWSARPASWLADRGVDVLIIRFKTDDPRTYAENWLRERAASTEGAALAAARAQVPQWLAYYESVGVRAISMGAVFLHKRTAGGGRPANFFRAETIPVGHLTDAAGGQIERLFRNEVLLRGLARKSALLDVPLAVAPACELVQHLRPKEGKWSSPNSVLRQVEGFDFPISLAPLPAGLLGRLDGSRPAGQIISEMAREMGADPAEACEQVLPFLVQMMEMTHLVVG